MGTMSSAHAELEEVAPVLAKMMDAHGFSERVTNELLTLASRLDRAEMRINRPCKMDVVAVSLGTKLHWHDRLDTRRNNQTFRWFLDAAGFEWKDLINKIRNGQLIPEGEETEEARKYHAESLALN